MTQSLVILITGVTGHIGFRVLTEALSSGHRVQAIVRKESQIAKIQANTAIQSYLPLLGFVLIPDLTAPCAFDAVPDGIGAIIHLASPTFSGFGDVSVSEFASTAWQVTNSVLQFAVKTPSVKRVVVTSSICAITPWLQTEHASAGFYTNKSPISVDWLKSQPDYAPGMQAYVLSKIYVADKVHKYVETNQLHFSVISILPGTTVGPNELASTPPELLAGSIMVALGPLLGIKLSPIPSIVSHIDDVAFAHIKALQITIPRGEITSILPVFNSRSNPAPIDWNDSIRIFQEDFPEAACGAIFPFGGTVPVARMLADSTEDEDLLGRKFKGYRDAVVDLVRQYLELASKESSTCPSLEGQNSAGNDYATN